MAQGRLPMAGTTAAMLLVLLLNSWAADAARMRLLQQRDQVRILALGDSITEGAVPSKNYNHPYTLELERQLRKAWPNTRIQIDNEGELTLGLPLHPCCGVVQEPLLCYCTLAVSTLLELHLLPSCRPSFSAAGRKAHVCWLCGMLTLKAVQLCAKPSQVCKHVPLADV